MLFFIIDRHSVVMTIFYIFVVRNVVIHGTVSGLGDEVYTGWVSFLSISAINTLFDDCPPEIVV